MDFLELKPGRSVEGNSIDAFRSEFKSPKYIYLLSGTHGDEVEGVFLLNKIWDWLKEQDDLKLPLIVLPILNPDGYRQGTRGNSHAVDLNRNYPSDNWVPTCKEEKYLPGKSPLSEPENKYLIKLFDKFSPGLVFSFHTWKRMVNFNGRCLDLATFIKDRNNYPIVEDIGHATPGSLGHFVPEKYKAPVITFECPELDDELELNDIWKENEKAFTDLLSSELIENLVKEWKAKSKGKSKKE